MWRTLGSPSVPPTLDSTRSSRSAVDVPSDAEAPSPFDAPYDLGVPSLGVPSPEVPSPEAPFLEDPSLEVPSVPD